MLKFLRKKRNIQIGLWLLVTSVIITFIFGFGPGRLLGSRGRYPKYAGIMFGKKIPIEKYVESKRQCYRQALMLYGKNLPKVLNYLNLDEQAWDRIMLLEEAHRRNIKISNQEVINRIENMSIFKQKGKFDSQRYNLIVRRILRIEPRQFEEEIRDNIKLAKLYKQVVGNIKLSEEELKQMYKNKNEKVKVSFLTIEPGKFQNEVKTTDEKLRKYYQQNKQQLSMPPQVNVEYLPITVDLTKGQVKVTEEETKSYYEDNKGYFKIKQDKKNKDKVEYRPYKEVKEDIKKIILHKKNKDKALDMAIEIRQKIKNGITFKKISKEYPINIKKTGFFSKNQSIPDIGWSYDFVKTAFNLKIGQISDIVELPNGYYILKLKDKKDSYIPEYKQIKQKVKKAFIQKEALSLAKEKAQSYKKILEEKIAQGESFQEVAKELSLKVKTTDYFTRGDYVKGVGQSQEFKNIAFSLAKAKVSQPIKVTKGYCLLTVKDFKPIDEKKFKEEKEDFRSKALEEKKTEIFSVWFNNLKKEANLKKSAYIVNQKS